MTRIIMLIAREKTPIVNKCRWNDWMALFRASRKSMSRVRCCMRSDPTDAGLGSGAALRSSAGTLRCGLDVLSSGLVTISGTSERADWSGTGLLD